MKTKSTSAIPFDAAFDLHVKHISSKRAPSKTNAPVPGLLPHPPVYPTDKACIILDSESSSSQSSNCIILSSSSSRSNDSSPRKSPVALKTSSKSSELHPIRTLTSNPPASPSTNSSSSISPLSSPQKSTPHHRSNSSLNSLSLTSNSPYSSPSLDDNADTEYVPTSYPARLPQRVLPQSTCTTSKPTTSSNPQKSSAPLSVESLKKQYARPSPTPVSHSPSTCSSLSSDISAMSSPPPPLPLASPTPRANLKSVVLSEKDKELEVITQRKYTRTLVFSGSRRQLDNGGTVPSLISLCQHVCLEQLNVWFSKPNCVYYNLCCLLIVVLLF